MDTETFYKQMIAENGSVNYNGKILALTQPAHPDKYQGYIRYSAMAIDNDGNEHWVAWNTTENWDEAERIHTKYLEETEHLYTDEVHRAICLLDDESNACDWDNPIAIEEY